MRADEIRVVGFGLLLIGGLVLLVSAIGCIGAQSEKALPLVAVSSIGTQAADLLR